MKAPLPFLVSGLGVAQIVTWGSLYYPIAVLGDSMQHDLGVSSTVLFAAFTLSLLISGMAAPMVGRLMEAHGARTMLCAGSVLGMAALLLLALANGPVGLFAGALVAGVAMAACLYDAAFMALNQLAGDAYRRSVTGLTLFGGFASTVSWPLSQLLLDALGWRQALLIHAVLQLVLCPPLHALLLPAELYGRRNCGVLLGRLARPAFVARALAPLAFPLGLAGLGTGGVILALGAISLLACWSYRAALRKASNATST
jgi:MFS family permease